MKKCNKCGRTINSSQTRCECGNDDSGDVLMSAAIGYMTDSAIMGTVFGGDPLGAVLGDMLNDSDGGDSLFD